MFEPSFDTSKQGNVSMFSCKQVSFSWKHPTFRIYTNPSEKLSHTLCDNYILRGVIGAIFVKLDHSENNIQERSVGPFSHYTPSFISRDPHKTSHTTLGGVGHSS